MKLSAAFLLILISSVSFRTFACGPYYPLGDDIRFTLLKPGTFNYPGFTEFNYTASLFYSPESNNDHSSSVDTPDSNIELWLKRCKNIPSYSDTYTAIYELGSEINRPNQSNSFIRYLYENNDLEAVKYLSFAKKCSAYNSIIDDPWERKEKANIPKRGQLITQALSMAKALTDPDLKLRYAFLAIRLSYYNDDFVNIKNTYVQYFSNRKSKNIIDYWSMYFMTFTETDSIKRNFYASQVFYYAPDKRDNIFHFYNKNVPVRKTLEYAESPDEKVAVLMMEGFRKTGKTLDVLKNLYSVKPDLQGLSFLLLREVNKLEDWIYTPYYANFEPSIEPWDYNWREEQKGYPEDKIRKDREYAQSVLDFVSTVDFDKVENPHLWKTAKLYLNYMTRNYDQAIAGINSLHPEVINDPKLIRILDILKALCIIGKQGENATITDDIKPVIICEFKASNNKFIFAVARELEFRGNTTEAAILLSKFKSRVNKDEEGYWRNGVYWRTKRKHYTLFVDYYDDYFFYLDAQYSTRQLNDLIEDVRNGSNKKDPFSKWEYSDIKKDIPRLYDLLGTKYLRTNDLRSALTSFESVNDTLWSSGFYPYKKYLDANPFYTNFFNEHSKTAADTIQFNKATLTAKLIQYLEEAENSSKNNRDYFYFRAANCYFNMTQYGNSWLMKRYFWTSYIHETKLEDDEDYFNCTLARQYYLKAKEVSKSKAFSALCLRMAGRCEKYRLLYKEERYRSDRPLSENKYYRNLKETYPGFYDELMGNCQSFEKYFNSRN